MFYVYLRNLKLSLLIPIMSDFVWVTCLILGKFFKNYYMYMYINIKSHQGPSWPWSYGSWIYNYLCNQCLSSLMLWVRIPNRARCTTSWDTVCQWLVTGRWFSPGTPVSSINKTDHHDISELSLKVALNIIQPTNQISL